MMPTLTGPLGSYATPVPPVPVAEKASDKAIPAIEAGDKGSQAVSIWELSIDIDDLDVDKDEVRRKAALTASLNCIPSVLDMRVFLKSNPRTRLSQWSQMDKSASVLLNWILTSNRSYIVQDGLVPEASSKPPGATLASERKITGLGSEWMQFRFQQGCPDKEHRFASAVEAAKLARHDYKALFAWHGSMFANWHSIVRQGLDFKHVVNGRAQGNGVYLSPDMRVSLVYASMYMIRTPTIVSSLILSTLEIAEHNLVGSCKKLGTLCAVPNAGFEHLRTRQRHPEVCLH
jgi:ubiquitin-conjugating enzyme E2 Q